MKRKFTIILAFLMMVFVGTSAQNLLVNGDFEDGMTGWNWDIDNPAGPEEVKSLGWIPFQGDRHLGLSSKSGVDGTWQVVEGLTPSASYQLSGYLRLNKSAEDEEMRGGVRNYGGDEVVFSRLYIGTPERPEDEWTEYSIEFTMGAANTSVEVFFQKLKGNNWSYADAFVLEPAGVSTSLEDYSISNVAAWVDNGALTVTNAAGGELTLLNLTGTSVLSVNLSSNNQVVGVAHLPAGVYIVSVLRDGKVFSSKVIK